MALLVLALGVSAGGFLAALSVGLGVFLGARATFNIMDFVGPRGLYQGTVGPLIPGSPFSLFASRNASFIVGQTRFPIERRAYELLQEGEVVLVEFFRFTRLPLTISRVQ